MSTIGAQVAQKTLTAMYSTHVPSAQEQCRIGVAGENDVQRQSHDPVDVLIASTALSAYRSVDDVYSGLGVLNKSLTTIAAGTSGALGTILARLATATMFETNQRVAQNQCQVGLTYARAIVDNAPDATQVALARTAMSAYTATENVYSGLGVFDATLADIPKALGKPVATTLAASGDRAMHDKNVASAQDQCHIGVVFTEAVRDNTTDDTTRKQAQATLDTFNKTAGVYAGLAVLDTFLKSVH